MKKQNNEKIKDEENNLILGINCYNGKNGELKFINYFFNKIKAI